VDCLAPLAAALLRRGLIWRGVSVVAVSRWLGHSSPEITYRFYAYLKPDDELAGRAIAETMRQLLSHVYPMCTEKGAEWPQPQQIRD
jgi:integrase